MEISFGDARLCAVFSSFDLLRKGYGRDIADAIAIRVGVLLAAPNLTLVPATQPISLRAEEDGFSVSLADGRRLRFRPVALAPGAATKPADITHIEILGVEE